MDGIFAWLLHETWLVEPLKSGMHLEWSYQGVHDNLPWKQSTMEANAPVLHEESAVSSLVILTLV